jgi:hypothetical protein
MKQPLRILRQADESPGLYDLALIEHVSIFTIFKETLLNESFAANAMARTIKKGLPLVAVLSWHIRTYVIMR